MPKHKLRNVGEETWPFIYVKAAPLWCDKENESEVAYIALEQQKLEAIDCDKIKDQLQDQIAEIYPTKNDKAAAYALKNNMQTACMLSVQPERDKDELPYVKQPEKIKYDGSIDDYIIRGILGPSLASATIPPQENNEVYLLKRPHIDRSESK